MVEKTEEYSQYDGKNRRVQPVWWKKQKSTANMVEKTEEYNQYGGKNRRVQPVW